MLRGGVVHGAVGGEGFTAVAIRDGRLAWVGDEDGAGAWIGAGTRVIDLGGRVVLPGFADGHAHLLGIGAMLETVDLTGTASFAEVVARALAGLDGLPPGAWLRGRGWDQNDWAVADFPTHHELSRAVPERPAVLARVDGHALLANAAAMRAAGVDAATPDPPGGRILRDASGAPTGVFIDAAEALILRAAPPPDAATLRRRALLAIDELHRHGITALHDAGVSQRDLDVYLGLAAEGRFALRLHAMLDGADESLLERWFARGPAPDLDGRGRIAVRAVKLYADGALGSRGAALLDDYTDEPGNRGLLLTAPERLRAVTERALRTGFQVAVHAIGDRGNRLALDAYEAALAAVPATDPRLRIEHVQVLAPEDMPRFAALGVIPAMQTQHQTSDMPWAEARLGAARTRGAYAWRALLDTGVPLCGGSDAPVERLDPLASFRAAVARFDARGNPPGGWHPEQCMTRAEALAQLTSWPAHAAFREADLGAIAVGMRADLVILSGDLLTAPVERLDSIQVEITIFDGQIVFSGQNPALPVLQPVLQP